ARYDAQGQQIGVAPRGVVYRDRMWHASSVVLVRTGDGQRIYLHKRTDEKLIYPGRYDCWAGGVVGPGESPEGAAERELAEELGITGAALLPGERIAYDDGELRCHLFTFEVRWDGPVRHQPEEVAWGDWVAVDALRDVLADPERWPFVPDGR